MAEALDIHTVPTPDGWRVQVEVRDDAGTTKHEVSVRRADLVRLAGEGVSPEEVVRASFEFLLERESKESILSRFELPVIARYFPDYPDELVRRLRTGPGR